MHWKTFAVRANPSDVSAIVEELKHILLSEDMDVTLKYVLDNIPLGVKHEDLAKHIGKKHGWNFSVVKEIKTMIDPVKATALIVITDTIPNCTEVYIENVDVPIIVKPQKAVSTSSPTPSR